VKFSKYQSQNQGYDRNPLSVLINDKITVRDYVEQILGKTDLFNHWIWSGYDARRVLENIQLPCVVKGSHGWRMQKIVFSKNDYPDIALLRKWQSKHISWIWACAQMRPGFLIEKLLPPIHHLYKIFCFNGVPIFIWDQYYDVSSGKVKQVNASMYDLNWINQGVRWNKTPCNNTPRPQRLDDMLEYSRKLSQGWKFLRCDLYCYDDKIRVSEITNYHANGTNGFSGDFDDVLGGYL